MTRQERRLYRAIGGTIPRDVRPIAPSWHRVTSSLVRKTRPEATGTHPGRGGRVVYVDGYQPFASASECARYFGLVPRLVRKAIYLHGRVTRDAAYLPVKAVRDMVARSRRKARRAA